MRKIIHIDMDAFFASVEQRDDPALRGKPVAVGGSGRRGVVAAASYEARRYGVRSAMPGMTAARLCPELIFVRGRYDVYKEASQQIRAIFHDYTDLVEPLSLDEAYLDVTENKKRMASATLIAAEIRKRIFETTQLTASAGVSYNKFLAKVASDFNKPNGMKVITPDEALVFLEKLPIEKFHGIGKVTARKMNNMGIFNGADLKYIPKTDLLQRFGKAGAWYYNVVRGIDNREVSPSHVRKSISAEETFLEDISDLNAMERELKDIADTVFARIKKADNFGRTVTLKVKSADFQIITRSRTYPSEIRKPELLLQAAVDLLYQNREDIDSVRLLGIGVSNLEKEQFRDGIQLELDFENNDE